MIQKQFYDLYRTLKEETKFLSFHDTDNPHFKNLVALGDDIIPLLLNNLWDSWWAIVALHYLSKGDLTIAEEDFGRFDLICQAWYNWGIHKGYINQ